MRYKLSEIHEDRLQKKITQNQKMYEIRKQELVSNDTEAEKFLAEMTE